MKRWAVLLYGVVNYVMFLGVFLYAIAFVGNLFGITPSLDGERESGFWTALIVNLMLLTVFAVQHSGMARPGFKKWITGMIPEPIERSTYVLFSNLAMIAMFIFWQPMGGTIWETPSGLATNIVYAIYFAGWGIVLIATFAICHFDLFGLRQVWLYFQGKPYTHHEFRIPMMYRIVRHPLYVGWLTVFWAAPHMTVAHLVFALATTGYILIAIQLEERDLVNVFGKKYEDYREEVPMLLPVPGTKRKSPA